MRRRHSALPLIWLLTDERQGDALWTAIDRLPRGAGIVVRHYSLARAERAALFRRIAAVARRRGLMVAFAGRDALRLGADAIYGGVTRFGLPVLYPAHDGAEMVAAARAGAALVLLSPVFPTRSHLGTRTLGPVRFGMLARTSRVPVVALGGMDAVRFRRLRGLGARGWAAIDGWIRT